MDPMQVLPITGFGTGGLATDIPSTKRTPAQLSVADNVRIQDGEISSIPEPVDVYTFSKTPVYAHPFYLTDETGGHVVCYSDATIEYIDATGAARDISPVTPLTDAGYFYATQINDLFLITNGTDVPHQISQAEISGAGVLKPMVNWDSNYRCWLLETFKSFVVAAKITIGGAEQRSLVKWSHPMSPGDTDLFWDHTDPTLLAGENVLAVSGRNITAIQSLRDNLLIYFDQAMWRMQNIGGEYVMGFTKVFTDDGAVSAFARADYDGTAIVVGFHDIYATDGFRKQSLSDRKITRSFYNNAVIDENLKMSYYPERREMFVLHKRNNNYAEPNAALIYNVDASTFTTIALPGETGSGGAVQFYMGPKFGGTNTTYDDAGTNVWTYDNSGERIYNAMRTSDEDLDFFLLAGIDQKLRVMDGQFTTAHRPKDLYVEVDRIDMSSVFGSTGDRIKYLSRLFPQATGADKIQVSVGVAMLSTGGIEWKPWVTYNLASDWAVDTRAAGRYLGLRLRMAPDSVNNFSLSGIDAELMVPDGGRR